MYIEQTYYTLTCTLRITNHIHIKSMHGQCSALSHVIMFIKKKKKVPDKRIVDTEDSVYGMNALTVPLTSTEVGSEVLGLLAT